MESQKTENNITVISQRLFQWSVGYLQHPFPEKNSLDSYKFSLVVNYALACELLIKSLRVRETHLVGVREEAPITGKKLNGWFGDLDIGTKDVVITLVQQNFPDYIYSTEKFDFFTVLDEQADVFSEWRSPYNSEDSSSLENKRGHYGFLFTFARALIDGYGSIYSRSIPEINNLDLIPTIDNIDAFYILS